MYYIGIDLGTSSLKGILVTKKGQIIKESSQAYDVLYPHDKWTEQNPADWVRACRNALKELSSGIEHEIGGISFGGQMHGLVVLDEDDNVIRPCILWNDGRTEKETEYLNKLVTEMENRYSLFASTYVSAPDGHTPQQAPQPTQVSTLIFTGI